MIDGKPVVFASLDIREKKKAQALAEEAKKNETKKTNSINTNAINTDAKEAKEA